MHIKSHFILIILIVFLICCNNQTAPKISTDWKEQFEKITQIDLPKNYKIISDSTFDSNSYFKKVNIQLNQKTAVAFHKNYELKQIDSLGVHRFFWNNEMDSVYNLFTNKNNLVHIYGKRAASPKYFKYNHQKTVNWTYILDTVNYKLTCIMFCKD